MSWHTKRIRWGACAVGALTAAVLAVSTTPAAASGTYSGRAYVWGNGYDVYELPADWDDEGELGMSTHASSNVTCLWQKILWADGELANASDVDGVFGSQTRTATIAWQKDENKRYNAGLQTDGGVGPGSFGWANWKHLFYRSGDSEPGQLLNLYYDGTHRDFEVRRVANGNYEFVDGDGIWRAAGYNSRSCR
ncbi:peptidoglycan-binding domain-containing protein [Streptomyces sp. NPDC002309]